MIVPRDGKVQSQAEKLHSMLFFLTAATALFTPVQFMLLGRIWHRLLVTTSTVTSIRAVVSEIDTRLMVTLMTMMVLMMTTKMVVVMMGGGGGGDNSDMDDSVGVRCLMLSIHRVGDDAEASKNHRY